MKLTPAPTVALLALGCIGGDGGKDDDTTPPMDITAPMTTSPMPPMPYTYPTTGETGDTGSASLSPVPELQLLLEQTTSG